MKFLFIAIVSVIAYLLSSMSSSIVISKVFFGKDVRKEGSGNAGATNVARVYGMKAGALTLLCDVMKAVVSILIGYFGVYFAMTYIVHASPEAVREAAELGKYFACGACMIGHCFPIYYHFKGGKGISVGLAISGAIDWRVMLLILGVFIIVVICTRIVSLSSICAAGSLVILGPIFACFPQINWAKFVLSILVGSLAIFMHRSNIVRLVKGEEKKFVPKMKDKRK